MKMYLEAFRIFNPGNMELDSADLKTARDKYSLRRSDRFTSMAVSAVTKKLNDAFPEQLSPNTGLVTATAFGPHRTTFATLDDILDYPEDLILPTRFSHSVHNAVASYVGTVLGIKGPVFALAGFEDVWFEALDLARNMMLADFCSKVLVIGIEEKALLTESAPELWPERYKEIPQEAVCVLLLSSEKQDNNHGRIELERTPKTAEQLFSFGVYQEFLDALAVSSAESSTTLHKMPDWEFPRTSE
ncbi:MAG: beta-ketoacyl synthase chain length factor [Victivallaceae bacterium]|nr:beta-ketoacyl synthase chain length factor [Victivallaceae bacterium]MDD4180723.1 beta-ketoacyl synthase chain length factor [Victivallaceae bacterium]